MKKIDFSESRENESEDSEKSEEIEGPDVEENEVIDLNEIEEISHNHEFKPAFNGEINLANLDVNTMPKEDVLNYLLSDKITISNPSQKKLDELSSSLRKSKFVSQNLGKKQKKKDYFQNPVNIYDFDRAYSQVASKIKEQSFDSNNELCRIMLFNNTEEVKKIDPLNKTEFSKKIDGYLEKKSKTLQNIHNNLTRELYSNCTFAPQTNNNNSSLNFNNFINQQSIYLQKINDKIQFLKEDFDKNNTNIAKPIVDPKSVQIYEEKIKTDVPTYLRLYNKRKIKEKQKKKKKLKFKENERINNLYNEAFERKSNLAELEKEVYKDNEKPNCPINSNKIILKRFVRKFRREMQNLEEEITENSKRETKANETVNLKENKNRDNTKLDSMQFHNFLIRMNFITTEKIKLEEQYKIVGLTESTIKQIENKLCYEIYENLKNDANLVDKENLFIFMLAILGLYEAYMLEVHQLEKKIETETEINYQKEVEENDKKEKQELEEREKEILKIKEKLKDKVKPDEVKIKQKTKKSVKNKNPILNESKEKQVNENKLIKKEISEEPRRIECKKEKRVIDKEKIKAQTKESLLTNLNNEIQSKIVISKPFGGFDQSQNFLLNFQNSKKISQEFSLLYVNFSSSDFFKERTVIKPINDFKKTTNRFKPTINEKSKTLSQNFRKKIITEYEPDTNSKLRLTQNSRDLNDCEISHNIEYIESLRKRKEKRKKDMALANEEKENKAIQDLTFKPKINNNFNLINKESHVVQSEEKRENIQRYLALNKMAKPSIEKADKNEEDLEIEEMQKNEKEYTFVPKISKKINIKDKSDTSQFYTKEYLDSFNKRIENGHIERKIKESVHERGIQTKEKLKESEKPKKSSKNSKKNTNKNQQNNKTKDRNLENDPSNGDPIPLLIIDVNIKQGVKKKIYIFDGDTSEVLSEKFARVHKLDNDTKRKLKNLIQNHMSKLLSRIDEEDGNSVSSA